MGFWIYCTVMTLLVPIIMLYFGWRFQKHPPRNINSLYGYRTSRSMKNQQTWDFAHRECGRLWFRLGLILLPVTLVAMAFLWGRSEGEIGMGCIPVMAVQLVVLLGSIFPVERALKRNFDQFGRKR